MSTNDDLSQFLFNLSKSVKEKSLSQDKLKEISLFRARYLFDETNITSKTAMKYFILGWYIYNQIEPLKNYT